MVLNKFTGSVLMDGNEDDLFKVFGTTLKHFASYVYLKALQAGDSIRIRVYDKVDDVSRYKLDGDVNDSVSTNNGTVTNISSLVSQWKFDGDVNDSVGSNNGTITYHTNLKKLYKFESNVNDTIGNGNGTIVGSGSSYVTGQEGNAILLDTSTYVTFPSTNLPVGTTDRTVSFWVKTPSTFTSGTSLFAWGSENTNKLFGLLYFDTSSTQSRIDAVAWGVADHATAQYLQINTWYHIVYTLSSTGATTNVYINGVLDTNFPVNSQAFNTDTSSVYLNNDPSTSRIAGGTYDEFRIYNTAVTSSQVKALYMNGKFAQSHTFDGSVNNGEFITFPSGSVVTGAGDRTYAFWYLPTSFVDALRIIEYGVNAGHTLFSIRLSGTAGKLALFDGTSSYASTGSLTTNVWNHVAFSISSSGTVLKIYINGILDSTTTITAINTTSSSLFMGTSLTSTSMLVGQLDEVRVYNSALSDSQVLGLYNYTGSNYISPLPIGNALSLNGSSYVTIPNETPYHWEITQAFSIAFWVKSSSIPAQSTMYYKFSGGGAGHLYILNASGYPQLLIRNTPTTNDLNVQTNNNVIDGTWHNVIVTYDGSSNASNVKFYIDGVLKTTTVNSNTLSSTVVNTIQPVLGAQTGGGNPYTGLLDEVQIYNYVVSSAEINAINAGRFANTHPIGLWHFDGDLYDYSGQGSTGSPTGTMTYVTGALSGSYGVPNTHFNFDGSETVNAGNVSNLNFERTNPLTITAWVRTTNNASQQIVSKFQGVNSGWYGGISAAGVLQFQEANANNTNDFTCNSGTTTNDGLWHFVTITYDGSGVATGVKFYVDGVLGSTVVGRNNLSGSILNTAHVVLGALDTSNNNPFVGELDDVRIYNRALSSAEVSDLYTYPDSGMKELLYDRTYSGVVPDAKYIPMLQGNQYKVTCQQISGTKRIIPFERWEVT